MPLQNIPVTILTTSGSVSYTVQSQSLHPAHHYLTLYSHNPYIQYVSILHYTVTVPTSSTSVSYTVQSQSLHPAHHYLTLYSHNPYIQYVSILHCTVTVPTSSTSVSYTVQSQSLHPVRQYRTLYSQSPSILHLADVTLKFFILAHVKGSFYMHYHLINVTLTIQSPESPCIYKLSLFSTMKQSLLNLV
jgi:hypothetical protein